MRDDPARVVAVLLRLFGPAPSLPLADEGDLFDGCFTALLDCEAPVALSPFSALRRGGFSALAVELSDLTCGFSAASPGFAALSARPTLRRETLVVLAMMRLPPYAL
ncbi:hypothetical protein MLD63_15320 [Paracoccus sp. TK19116]|uniref:Uncharacterized protein n=1 Tax=Paracoccus albicereus TaxID=2922394 RepID=A0ABT1MY40_9RHOB|nr:hypothetical protein [Paracoccus albicereus]MCQ0971791.1 hypothetical protein [Paracoccus albicereus]